MRWEERRMAEYMDYNEVDEGPKTKRAKIKDRIIIILSASWLIALVLWVIIGTATRETVRSQFKTQSGKTNSIGAISKGENEFYSLYMELQEGDVSPKTLKSDYPTVYKWIKKPPKQYPTNSKPKSLDKGGYVTVYLPYVVEGNKELDTTVALTEGTIGFDVLMLPYSSDKSGNISLSAPVRYSFRYDCESRKTTLYELSTDRYRLNFYQMSIKFDSAVRDLSYDVSLTYPLIKSESENSKIQKNILLGEAEEKLTAGGEVSDSALSCEFSGAESDTLVLEFDDLMYRKFGQITVHIDPKKVSSYTISIN